jgi:hypothetical protein
MNTMPKSVPTIPRQTFRQIARTLLAKTKAGQVNWVRKPIMSQGPDTTYEVILPESRIELTYGVPRAEPDFISLRLKNPNGVAVDSWTVDEPDWGDAEDPNPAEEADPEGEWRLLYDLFTEVHRQATGWDKVVSDIQRALAESGSIGDSPRR